MVGKFNSWSGKRRAAAAVVLAIAGSGGFLGLKRYRGRAPAESASPGAVVAQGDIEVHFADSGELTPKVRVDVASKMSGRVVELLVDEGQRVRKGERLAVIQPGRTEAEKYVPASVTSPIDGVVMRYQRQAGQEESVMVRLGDYVTGLMESNSPTYLMSVADLSRLVVKMKISEMDILKLKEGMPVTVTVDAMPEASFPAKVTLVSPQADRDNNNLKSFKVEVSLLKNDPLLKPGMTARVDGLLESRKQVLKIPLSAVFEEGGKEFAYPERPDGKTGRVALKLGLRNETEAEVAEGLKAGEKVLTEKPKDQGKKS